MLGVEQMRRLPEFLARRERNFARLDRAVARIPHTATLAYGGPDRTCAWYCYPLMLKDLAAERRREIMLALKERGAGVSIYYPRPVPGMTYYTENAGSADECFPAASRISATSLALPVGPHLDETDMDALAEVIEEVVHEQTA